MKKPTNYSLKKWLCENAIAGIIIHYPVYDSEDTCHTEVTLISTMEEKKRTRAEAVWSLIKIDPDWAFLAHVKPEVEKEIKDWDIFVEKEVVDLEEYARLKRKFED
jgi:hypothetical protein